MALAFPRVDLDFLAWVAWAPVLWLGSREVGRRRWFPVVLAGVVMFFVSLRWLTETMINFGGMAPPLAYVTLGLLSVYLSLYPTLATIGALVLERRARIPLVLGFPTCWVAAEYLRSILLTGFPWNLLGHSLWRRLALCQLAAVTGVYGLSWLLAAHNAALAALWRRPGRRSWGALAGVWAAVLISALAGGRVLERAGERGWRGSGRGFAIALIQGNIPQEEKWVPSLRAGNLDVYRRLTEDAFERGARVVVWPEASAEFYYVKGDRYRFRDGVSMKEAVDSLVRDRDGYLLFGAPDQDEEGMHYNAAFLLGPGARLLGRYRKQHLVPFGEYVPLRRLLFFVDKLVILPDDFGAGKETVVMELEDAPLGVYICYETAFPDLLRRFRRKGARWLVNLTNDAWFGRSDGPYQHFAMTVFRAIENRLPIARCANTGISGIIDPWGRILARSQLFKRMVIRGWITPRVDDTLYARYGDVFAWMNLALAVVALGWPALRGRSRKRRGNGGGTRWKS
jgi:apolipoprotein N-acyltransferase